MKTQIEACEIIIPLESSKPYRLVAAYLAAARKFGPTVVGLYRRGKYFRSFYVEVNHQSAVQEFLQTHLA